MKDYYKILELDVSATQPEIKKAYRRLALQFHPDKNQSDPYTTARFNEIKEAYDVLTDPRKKEYYLEQRWFQQSAGKKKTVLMVTPVDILKALLDFDKHVSRLDVHRMSKQGIWKYLAEELLNDDVITKLNKFNEQDINQTIIRIILKNLFAIPAEKHNDLKNYLLKINPDKIMQREIDESIKKHQRLAKIEFYKPLVLFVIVILITIVIYFISQ